MEHVTFRPSGVCSTLIDFDLDGGTLRNVRFTGGCDGNLKAIARLVEGRDAAEVAKILMGNECHGKGTSCADQFARAIFERR